MEYKYHPVFKHLTYFIISYMFLRHQKLMNNELLLANTIILTLFMIILDHLFISGHITPFEEMKYEYIDEEDINDIEKQLNKEKKKKKKDKKRKNRDKIEETVQLQNHHEEQIMNEANNIQLNHPNNLKCNSHSQFVRMENNLDNYEFNNSPQEMDLPSYMAYNE